MHKNFNIRCDFAIGFFLVLATIAVYWQVQNHDFVTLDDPFYVTENQHVKAGLTGETVIWAFTTTHAANWHPLTWISHMVDCMLFGLEPGNHHLTNLFFHVCNTLLLFIVLRRMTGEVWKSGFVAALFALHPLHVESVAWVSERKDVLSTLFWMLTLWAYSSYAKNPGLKKFLPVLFFFSLGLMAKPMLVTLPFVLILLDYWPLGRFRMERFHFPAHVIREKLFLFILAAISGVITLLAQHRGGAVESLDVLPLTARMGSASASYVSYLAKMVWPHHLAVYYPHPGALHMWKVLGACLVLAGISVAVIRAARRYQYLAVGWFWYMGTLVPVIGLLQVGSQAMADRYTYVPFIGLFIIVAWGIPDLLKDWRYRKSALASFAGILIAALMMSSWFQVQYWRNSINLYEHALEVTTDNAMVHNLLGHVLFQKGEVDEAIVHFSETLRINPRYVSALNNLGNALEKQARVNEAIVYYLKALQVDPEFSDAHNNLGNALAAQGKHKEAMRHYAEALRIKPDFVKAHNNLGLALEREGDIEKATHHYVKALRLNPHYAEAHYNLGNALAHQGSFEEAVEHYFEALRINPGFAEAHNNLGNVFLNQRKLKEAVSHYAEALRLEPDHTQAHHNLEKASAALTRIEKDIARTQKSLKRKPGNPALHCKLGALWYSKGAPDRAIAEYRKALSHRPGIDSGAQQSGHGIYRGYQRI